MAERTVTLYVDNKKSEPKSQRLAPDKLHKTYIDAFETEQGDKIVNLRVAYRVFGRPNTNRDNFVLVFHALTGDANCGGYDNSDGHIAGWWESLFKAGRTLNTDEHCIICLNHPGSCYGSSGPLDCQVGDRNPLGLEFPDLSVRDLVDIQVKLLEYLEIRKLKLAIGGSLGGMVSLELAIMVPDLAEKIVVIAAPALASAQALAFNHIQRKCFDLDRDFKNGEYYNGPRPQMALGLARQIAMITYRNRGEFDQRFGRTTSIALNGKNTDYEIQNYLNYQGGKLIQRFDPNSYLKLLNILDSQDIGRDRYSLEDALNRIQSEVLFVSVDTDILYPTDEVHSVFQACLNLGKAVAYDQIKSIHGHDAFLLEYDQVDEILQRFLGG